jgi:glutamyl-tRNA reductase
MHQIGVVGLSYRHVGVDEVARFSVPKAEVAARLPALRDSLGVAEVFYVGTCNRVEVLYSTEDGESAGDARQAVFRALIGREPKAGEATRILRAWTGEAAVEHLFLVACGLDSAQAGEQEIAAQIRLAWEAARAAQVCGPTLDRLLGEALSMANRVRRLESNVRSPSLADLAADRLLRHLESHLARQTPVGVTNGHAVTTGAHIATARRIADQPAGTAHGMADPPAATAHRTADAHAATTRDVDAIIVATSKPTVALIGVSPMTRRCGMTLHRAGLNLLIVNRTLQPAEEFAATIGAQAVSLDDFRDHPPELGGLVLAAGGTEPILRGAALAKIAAAAGPLTPLLIDFGVPPNADPEAAVAAGIARVGMDDLIQAAQERRLAQLMRLAPVRAAIDERLTRLRSELATRAIGKRLADLRGTFEQIAADEADRALSEELRGLDENQREQIQRLASTVARRLAHLPLAGLRAAAAHASTDAVDAFFREARLRRNGPNNREPHS